MRKPKKEKVAKPEWKHRFFCLAKSHHYSIPASEADKDLLYKAGLGERTIEFQYLNIDSNTFRESIYETFPKLRSSGGYEMCKGKTNSLELEPLSNMAYQSPAMLKERCGYSKTYLVPLQRDLDLSELSSTSVSRIVSMHRYHSCSVFPSHPICC